MGRSLTVARREYLERVRSKAFVIGTIVGPLLMAGLMIGPALIAAKQKGRPLRVAVVDAGGELRSSVEAALAGAKDGPDARFVVQGGVSGGVEAARVRLRQDVLDGRLDGYLLLPADALASSVAEYYGKSVTNRFDLRLMDRAVEEVLVGRRLQGEGLDPQRIKGLTRPLDLKTFRVSASGEKADRGITFLFSTVLMMLIYISVLMWGQALMTGVIEEKTSRVVELAVSAMSPWDLLFGKLIGVGAAGLTQLGVWVASMAVFAAYGGSLMPTGGGQMPEVTPLLLGSFLVFFLLGYFLYGSMYAAIGAAVNTVQEAQNLAFPAMMPVIASVVMFPVVLQSPDSTLSVVLSLIPFATPILMFLRITVLTPPMWQIALSIVLTTLTVVGVTWVSSRIYRVGILMYGKRPTFPEMLRWVRHS